MLENKTGDKFLMLKIKEIKNSLHAIENIENLSKKKYRTLTQILQN